jgi:hypothetical protein
LGKTPAPDRHSAAVGLKEEETAVWVASSVRDVQSESAVGDNAQLDLVAYVHPPAEWLTLALSLKTPDHEQHYGKMAELILKNEAPGILNWLLEGRTKLAQGKLQLTQTPEQKARAATLLLASDSPAAFVRSCLVKKRDEELGVVDLYAHYQDWCRENHVRPFAFRPFTSTAKEEIEIGLGMKLRHDLEGGNGKARRGWKGLGLFGRIDLAKPGNESCGSGA